MRGEAGLPVTPMGGPRKPSLGLDTDYQIGLSFNSTPDGNTFFTIDVTSKIKIVSWTKGARPGGGHRRRGRQALRTAMPRPESPQLAQPGSFFGSGSGWCGSGLRRVAMARAERGRQTLCLASLPSWERCCAGSRAMRLCRLWTIK